MICGAAATASGQVSRRVAVGAAVGIVAPTDENLDRVITVGPLYSLRRGDGWGPAVGFSWYQTQDKDDLVEYRVRPVMVGVAYNATSGRFRVSPSVVAGYSFNRATVKGDSAQRVDFKDSFAWRPGVSVWWDTDTRISLNTFLGYLVTRGDIDFGTGPRGDSSGRLKADALIWTAGVAVWVY
jgi:hypothetical protein